MHAFPPSLAPAALALAALLPAQTPSSDTAVGVFPFLVGNMDGRINEIVNNCTTRDIDTLYVSVYRATGPQTGDLWITDRAGSWNPSWGSVRPTGAGIDLVNLISAAHAANLRVVGVLKCFDASVQPTHAGHRAYLLDVIDYLCNSFRPDGSPWYDMDGIALDYIRFVGSGVGNNPSFVTNFLRDVRGVIGPLSLHCYLLANRYTFHGPSYTGPFHSYASVISSLASQFGQHWEQMARWVDVMMPMTYTANGNIYSTYSEHQAYVRQAAAYCRTACNIASFPTRRVTPVVRTYTSGSETTTAQTVQASITGALLGGGDGYQAFRYGHLLNQPTWWAEMARYAVPGQNWPIPDLQVPLTGLTGDFDPTGSRDADEPSAQLQVRFDFDGDGVMDTGWQSNAVVSRLLPYPGDWIASLQVRDQQLHVSTTRRRVRPTGVLSLQPAFYSASFGGSLAIHIDAGPAAAGQTYLVIGTLSGTTPGFTWEGLPVPINVDWVTDLLVSSVNSSVLQNGLGLLDAQGRATATFSVPAGLLTGFRGRTVHWGVLAAGPTGQAAFTGEAEAMLIGL